MLTLAVNGTTTGALLRALGLTRPDVSVQVAVDKARRHIRRQCMAVYHDHLTTHDDVMGTADFRVVQVHGRGRFPNPTAAVHRTSVMSTAVIKRKCTTHSTSALFGPITRTPIPHTTHPRTQDERD